MGDPGPEVLEGEYIEAEPTAAARDRASKSKPGSSKRRDPKRSTVSKVAAKLSPKFGDPVSPGQCTQALYAFHVTEATALRSEVELERNDFATEGEAFSYFANNTFPPARLLVRAAPLFIVASEEIRHQRRILEAVPPDVWWRRRFGRQPAWQPEVIPGYESAV